jgi:hypothetical protein
MSCGNVPGIADLAMGGVSLPEHMNRQTAHYLYEAFIEQGFDQQSAYDASY